MGICSWWGEDAAFDDVLVGHESLLEGIAVGLAQIPSTSRLVGGGGKEPAAIEGGAKRANPLSVTPKCAQAVAGGHVPDTDGLVTTGTRQQVTGERSSGSATGDKAHAANAVVVTRQGADILVLVGRIPQLDGQVGAARGEQGATTWASEVNIQHGFGVRLEGALELAQFVVPHLNAAVFASTGHAGESGVEGYARYRLAVRLQGITGRGAGQPGGGVVVAPCRQAGGCCTIQLMLKPCCCRFEVENLLLQPHHRRPLFFQQALVLACCGRFERTLRQADCLTHCPLRLAVSARREIGNERFVPVRPGISAP